MPRETREEVLRMCEAAYVETKNPLFVWYAIFEGCFYYDPLPSWIMDYLMCSANCVLDEGRTEKGPPGIVNLAGAAEVFGRSGIAHGGSLPPDHPLLPARTGAIAAGQVASALGLVRKQALNRSDPLRGWKNAFDHWRQLGRAQAVVQEAQGSRHVKQKDRKEDAGRYFNIKVRSAQGDVALCRRLKEMGFWQKLREARARPR
jgi:hypothetical protein